MSKPGTSTNQDALFQQQHQQQLISTGKDDTGSDSGLPSGVPEQLTQQKEGQIGGIETTDPDLVAVDKMSVDDLKKSLKDRIVAEKKRGKKEADLEEREKALDKRQEDLDMREEQLRSKGKRINQEMKNLSAMQREMDSRIDEPKWSELRKKILDNESKQNQRYNEGQRRKMLHSFDKHLDKADKYYKELERKSNIAGMKGLKREEEIRLRSKIIEEKSGAMMQYISLTCETPDEEKTEILREEANKWVRLRNMYSAFGDEEGEAACAQQIDGLRGSLLKADLDEMKKAGMNPDADIDVDDEEEETTLGEKQKTATEMINAVSTDIDLVTQKDEKVQSEDAFKQGLEDHDLGWLKDADEKHRKWIILYGKFDYNSRMRWIDSQIFKEEVRFTEELKAQNKDAKTRRTELKQHMDEFKLKPEFVQPTKEELEECLNFVLDAWKAAHTKEIGKFNEKQNALWQKKMIPELDETKDPLGKLMRQCVNNLHSSLYVLVTHDARQVSDAQFHHAVKKQENPQKDDPFQGYEYEVQDRANDCWSVALTGLLNYNRGEEKKKYTQTDVRSYDPKFREKVGEEKDEDHQKAIADVRQFTTENQDKTNSFMGNVFALSDYIAQELGNVAVRHMVFNVPKCKLDDKRNPGKNAVHNVTEVLKETIKTALSAGQPIAVLTGKHYRMIVDADQDGVVMVNSAGKGTVTDRYTYKQLMELRDTLELTWVQKEDLDKLPEEFDGLKLQDDKFSSEHDEIPQDPDLVAITQGVVVHKKAAKLGEDVSDYISERVYVPKQLRKEEVPAAEPKKVEKKKEDKKDKDE